MSAAPRVFITHAVTQRTDRGDVIVHDYSQAERFGTIQYVTIGRPDWGAQDAFLVFEGALRDFRPDVDYLLATGDPVAIAASVAAAVATIREARSFMLLAFAGYKRGGYNVVHVPIPTPAEAGEPK